MTTTAAVLQCRSAAANRPQHPCRHTPSPGCHALPSEGQQRGRLKHVCVKHPLSCECHTHLFLCATIANELRGPGAIPAFFTRSHCGGGGGQGVNRMKVCQGQMQLAETHISTRARTLTLQLTHSIVWAVLLHSLWHSWYPLYGTTIYYHPSLPAAALLPFTARQTNFPSCPHSRPSPHTCAIPRVHLSCLYGPPVSPCMSLCPVPTCRREPCRAPGLHPHRPCPVRDQPHHTHLLCFIGSFTQVVTLHPDDDTHTQRGPYSKHSWTNQSKILLTSQEKQQPRVAIARLATRDD